MLLPRFDYRAARSVREALDLCAEVPNARYLAGGTDLLPQLRARRKVARVVDLKRIEELSTIRERDGGIAIGASVPMSEVCAHAGIRKRYPILVQCCEEVGAWPLRHRATVVGNICNASPAADTSVALLALDAKVAVQGPRGGRTLPIADFFLGPGRTALEPGELVTEIHLPKAAAGFEGRYLRLSRRKGMDLATVGVLVARSAGRDPSWRVGLVAVAPRPLRVREAESLLEQQGRVKALQAAAQLAVQAATPITDVRGTAEYRREMVGVLLARGLASIAA